MLAGGGVGEGACSVGKGVSSFRLSWPSDAISLSSGDEDGSVARPCSRQVITQVDKTLQATPISAQRLVGRRAQGKTRALQLPGWPHRPPALPPAGSSAKPAQDRSTTETRAARGSLCALTPGPGPGPEWGRGAGAQEPHTLKHPHFSQTQVLHGRVLGMRGSPSWFTLSRRGCA